jgi:hypothetical protein
MSLNVFSFGTGLCQYFWGTKRLFQKKNSFENLSLHNPHCMLREEFDLHLKHFTLPDMLRIQGKKWYDQKN